MNEMLKTLSRRSFAANRLQNLIAVLAIALTAVLFTSVTTIGMGVMERFVEKAAEGFHISKEDQKLMASFYRAALTGMVLDWLAHGMKYEPEDEIRRMGVMLKGSIETAFANMDRTV